MPVILDGPEARAAWLDPGVDFDGALESGRETRTLPACVPGGDGPRLVGRIGAEAKVLRSQDRASAPVPTK
jgi:hypothetical protein